MMIETFRLDKRVLKQPTNITQFTDYEFSLLNTFKTYI